MQIDDVFDLRRPGGGKKFDWILLQQFVPKERNKFQIEDWRRWWQKVLFVRNWFLISSEYLRYLQAICDDVGWYTATICCRRFIEHITKPSVALFASFFQQICSAARLQDRQSILSCGHNLENNQVRVLCRIRRPSLSIDCFVPQPQASADNLCPLKRKLKNLFFSHRRRKAFCSRIKLYDRTAIMNDSIAFTR